MTDESDECLIEGSVKGDGQAFARLVERHYDMIYRVAYKWCGNQEDAEDVAQEVCVKLGRSIRGFSGNSAFSSWLYRVTLNAVRDFQRGQIRQERKAADMALVSDSAHIPDPERDLTEAQVWNHVLDLPDKQRDAVMLVYAEGLNHKYASEIMGCSESTVSWHVHEAKRALKNFVKGPDDE